MNKIRRAKRIHMEIDKDEKPNKQMKRIIKMKNKSQLKFQLIEGANTLVLHLYIYILHTSTSKSIYAVQLNYNFSRAVSIRDHNLLFFCIFFVRRFASSIPFIISKKATTIYCSKQNVRLCIAQKKKQQEQKKQNSNNNCLKNDSSELDKHTMLNDHTEMSTTGTSA